MALKDNTKTETKITNKETKMEEAPIMAKEEEDIKVIAMDMKIKAITVILIPINTGTIVPIINNNIIKMQDLADIIIPNNNSNNKTNKCLACLCPTIATLKCNNSNLNFTQCRIFILSFVK